jgi:predicted glycosyltransferase
MQTVEQVLTSASYSVTLINDINSDTHNVELTQEQKNNTVQRNVDHLESILAYTDPDVVGDSSDKTPYTTAIATGKAYIEDNS